MPESNKIHSLEAGPALDMRRSRSTLGMALPSPRNSTVTDPYNVPISSSGFQKLLPKFLRMKFEDVQLEKLYQDYQRRIKRDAVNVFLSFSFCFSVVVIVSSSVTSWSPSASVNVTCVVLSSIYALIVLSTYLLMYFKKLPEKGYQLLPYMLWILFCVLFYSTAVLSTGIQAEFCTLAWQNVLIYCTFMTLPLNFSTCLILSVFSSVLHLTFVVAMPYARGYEDLFDKTNLVS